MAYRFELAALLRYREHQRDQCRQLLGEVQQDLADCTAEADGLLADRADLLTALRSRNASGVLDISAVSARRYELSQLDGQQRILQAKRDRIEQQLQLCRLALQQADAAVKTLESLREKREMLYRQQELKRVELEVQETWSATRFSRHE